MIDVNELHEEGVMSYSDQRNHCIGMLKSLRNNSKMVENHPDPQSHEEAWGLLEEHIFAAFNALMEKE